MVIERTNEWVSEWVNRASDCYIRYDLMVIVLYSHITTIRIRNTNKLIHYIRQCFDLLLFLFFKMIVKLSTVAFNVTDCTNSMIFTLFRCLSIHSFSLFWIFSLSAHQLHLFCFANVTIINISSQYLTHN